MQVLSRKPASKATPSIDPATGLAQLSVDDEDEDEDDATKNTLTMQERQEKAQREREEKQRKYEEVRQKLFGTEEASTPSKTGSISPAKNNGGSRNQSRNKAPETADPRHQRATGLLGLGNCMIRMMQASQAHLVF